MTSDRTDRRPGGHHFDVQNVRCTKCGMLRKNYDDKRKPCTGEPISDKREGTPIEETGRGGEIDVGGRRSPRRARIAPGQPEFILHQLLHPA